VNTLVGAAIRPRVQADLPVTAPPPRQQLATALDTDKLYRLIGVEPPKPVEVPEDATPARPQTCQDRAARPVKTALRLQLVAGVLAERPVNSLVTLLDPSTREARVMGVGEEFGGARLLGVERMRDDGDVTGNAFKVVAVICNAGTKEFIDAEAGAGEAAPNVGTFPVPGRPVAPVGRVAGASMEGIKQVGDDRYEIQKNVIDSALSNLNTLATQARLVPSFRNGVANGFKLFQIQPGSLYAAIGIQNGDVITRINGYEINSPDKALEIYQKLRDLSHFTVELERAGQVIKKDYSVGP
jgi:general secretion pathway protein C